MWGGVLGIIFAQRFASILIGRNFTEVFALGVLDQHSLICLCCVGEYTPVEQATAPVYMAPDMTIMLHTASAWRRSGSVKNWFWTNKTSEWFDQRSPEDEPGHQRFFDSYLKGELNGWETTLSV